MVFSGRLFAFCSWFFKALGFKHWYSIEALHGLINYDLLESTGEPADVVESVVQSAQVDPSVDPVFAPPVAGVVSTGDASVMMPGPVAPVVLAPRRPAVFDLLSPLRRWRGLLLVQWPSRISPLESCT